MLTSDLRPLVRETVGHAMRWNDNADHTVGAGLLTRSGKIVLGLNTYHFLGGPCGEIAALSNYASSAPGDALVAIAAAYGPSGDIISPCGKCRQILFDIDPNIQCVVRTANGLEARPVRELLPLAFDWRAAENPQRIYMWEGYEAAIRSGLKRQTIRVDDPFRTGPAVLVFEKESGETIAINAEVTELVSIQRDELTEEHAIKDGFNDLAELQNALDLHYPGLCQTEIVDIVTFTTDSAPTESTSLS